MNTQRIVGIILLVAGAAFLIIGLNASNSMADQLSNTFRGRFTDHTQWYIVGGAVGAVVGLSMLAIGSRGKNA